jgi:rhodanese-related sulfurtransferase
MAREYTAEELKAKMDRGERFYLVDALPADSYQHRHLPGALNLPIEELRSLAGTVLPEKTVEIVAYCSSPH